MKISDHFRTGETFVKYESVIPRKELTTVKNSNDVYKYLRANVFDAHKLNFCEETGLLMLNNANNIIGWYKLSTGSRKAALIDPAIIFFHAIVNVSAKIILAHNHPSGNLRPSPADIKITEKVKKGAEFFDITLLDHMIITSDNGFFSFADDGIL